jgi:uncharacterized protein
MMNLLRLGIISAVSAIVAGTAQAQTISIGTSPVGSLNYSVGNALGKVMNEVAGLKARVVPFGGGQQFLPLIGKKELEMAIPSASDALFAYRGEGDFKGNPVKGLREIGTVFPFYIGWFVRKDSPYKSMTDLKGKRIAVGFSANSAQHRASYAGLAVFGVKDTDFIGVPVPHVVRGADDFMQGKIEATSFAAGAGKVAEVNAKIPIRFLSMPKDDAALARLHTLMPAAYLDTVQPSPAFAGIIGPTVLIFEDYVVMAGAQMSDDDAYKIAKALHDSQDKLAAVAKTFGRYDKDKLARDRGVPFHPGAIKYYKEKGIWPSK